MQRLTLSSTSTRAVRPTLSTLTRLCLATALVGVACGEDAASDADVDAGSGGGGQLTGGQLTGGENAGGQPVAGGNTGGEAGGGAGGAGGALPGGAGGAGGMPSYSPHAEGYEAPEVHGLELKTGVLDCRTCHGMALEGGIGPSCDECHQPAWRTTCTYCHGGGDTETGAPPRELRPDAAPTFAAHTSHTSENNHVAWDCGQCHRAPVDVMTEGHVFDATAGKAEVDFSGGLSPQGTWDGTGCANLYCHGNGRANGAIEHTAATPDCNGCHDRNALGGEHREHVRRNIACGECHSATAEGTDTIIDVTKHVNGEKDVAITAAGFTFSAGTCTGTCHGEGHRSRRW